MRPGYEDYDVDEIDITPYNYNRHKEEAPAVIAYRLLKAKREEQEVFKAREAMKAAMPPKPAKLNPLEEQIKRAIAIHEKVKDARPGKDYYCGYCSSAYPCATVQALTEPIE